MRAREKFSWLGLEERVSPGGGAVGLFGVEDSTGVSLFFELLVENPGELVLDFGVCGIVGEVGHFEIIFGGVVEFLGGAFHEPVDEFFVVRI